MATEIQHEEVLEIIGLVRTKKDMVVLGALLKSQKDASDFIGFETLREQLANDEGGRKGKDSLIYRSLSVLEKEGFLKIDRVGHKHGYNSSIAMIEKALERTISKSIKNLEKELNQLDSEVTILSDMNPDNIASSIIDLSVGKRKIDKPVFVQGWDDFLKLIDNKVFKGLKGGDVIRITLEWVVQHDYLNARTLNSTANLLEKGIDFRSLDHDKGEKVIRDRFTSIIEMWRNKGYKAGYRVFPRKDATYQFVARNSEGLVLVVSESPFSVTWIPRNANPDLVDDAIDNFDHDYDEGIDILDFKE